MAKQNIFGKRIFILVLASLFLLSTISALSISINMNPTFSLGQNVSFSYTFLSSSAISGTYTIGVSCPNAPIPLLSVQNFSLGANIPLIQAYTYISNLTDNVDPQTCNTTVSTISPISISQSQSFALQTNPRFNFNVAVCKDAQCNRASTIFDLDNNIYLEYMSNETNLSVKSVLTYPDGSTESLNLPAQITANQKGTYSLNVNASKTGYKTINEQISFGVIQSEVNIPYTSISSSQTGPSGLSVYIIIIALIVLALITIVSFILFRLIKKREKK
ncbi:MAG: hypothetical protein WAU65_02730 [Candidatus Nanoarchaeia archaeon]